MENAMVGVLAPDDGDEGLYLVSQGCLTRQTSPLAPRGHFYRVSPTYSFYELKLAASPGKVTEATKHRAQYSQYYADLELRKLSYHDTAYAPLDEIFDEAAVEWQIGEFYSEKAKNATGRDSIYSWGKAIRAYTQCQALANQVRNALKPPAASPEDLDLRPWMFWSKE